MDRRIANRCLRASASYCPLSPLCARSIHSHFLWLYSAAGVYYTSTYQGVANSAGCSTVDNCRRCMLNWWIEAGTCWTNWPNFRQLCGFRMVVTLRSRAVRDANDNNTKEEVLKHHFWMLVLACYFSGLRCCRINQRCTKRSNHSGCFHWSAYRSLGWEKSPKFMKWPIFLSLYPDSAPLSCPDWSLQRKWFQWSVWLFGNQGTVFWNQAGVIKWTFRLTGSVAWWGPLLSSTLCCLVDFWVVSSHFFRW